MEEINNIQNVNLTDQLDALNFKMKSRNNNATREKSERILENETLRMRKEIPKEETQHRYGDAARKLKSMQLKTRYVYTNTIFGNP